jgi:hypothetical protein
MLRKDSQNMDKVADTTTPPIAPIASDFLLSCKGCVGKVSL